MVEGRNRFQFRMSTVALVTAVVALSLSLCLLTMRHNAQLRAMSEQHNARLVELTARYNARLREMAARGTPREAPGPGEGSAGP